MVNASGVCCVGVGMRSGAPRGSRGEEGMVRASGIWWSVSREGGGGGAMVWVGEWCVRCEGKGRVIHASGLCCVGLGMRSGAPRGTGGAAEGVLHGAARGSCWSDGLGERAREMNRCVVLGMKGRAIAGTRCSEMVRPGICSVLATCGRGRLMSCATACTGRLGVVCGVGARVIGRFSVGTLTWGL